MPGTMNWLDEELMLLITRSQLPLLLMVTSRSLNEPMQTLPKLPLFAMPVAMFGSGAFPETGTTRLGTWRSLLMTEIVPDFAPAVVG